MYNYSKKRTESQIKLKEEIERERRMKHRSVTPNKLSNQMVENKQRSSLSEIFKLLDSDHDGWISSQKISIQSLPVDILEIISPLLCEMEEINEKLNENEFINSATNLYKTLSLNQKNAILNF